MITYEEVCQDVVFLETLPLNLDWTIFREAGYETFFYKHDNEDPIEGVRLSKLSTGDDEIYVPFV